MQNSSLRASGWESQYGGRTTKATARHPGNMTYTHAPVVCEKNIFPLFCFTQPVENYRLTKLCALFSKGYSDDDEMIAPRIFFCDYLICTKSTSELLS